MVLEILFIILHLDITMLFTVCELKVFLFYENIKNKILTLPNVSFIQIFYELKQNGINCLSHCLF